MKLLAMVEYDADSVSSRSSILDLQYRVALKMKTTHGSIIVGKQSDHRDFICSQDKRYLTC